MKKFILSISLLTLVFSAIAQDFITRGTIEYEVKLNTKKMYGEVMKEIKGRRKGTIVMGGGEDQMPEYHTTKKQLLFSGDKLLYRSSGQEDNEFLVGKSVVYTDLQERRSTFRSGFFGSEMVFEDTLAKVRWKIEDETRSIAGWKCRKAVGVIMDSVYVVAFYCPEIVPQGGPEYFSGLPGMILGMAIPRMYTTWFATKIQVTVDDKKILPPAPDKKQTVLPIQEARAKIREDMKSYVKKETPDAIIDASLKGLMIRSMFANQY